MRPPQKNVPFADPNEDSATDNEISHTQLPRTLFLEEKMRENEGHVAENGNQPSGNQMSGDALSFH